MGYSKNVISGIWWMGLLRLLTRVLAIVRIAILARLLGPDEFGLFAVASIALAFLEIITETGINAYLVQEEGNIKKNLNSAWVISIIRGFIISLLIVAFSSPVVKFFDAERALPILLLISVTPILRGLINPSVINLQKNLMFKKDFFLRITVFLFDTIVSVFLAFYLRSAISIAIGMIVGSIVEIIISFTLIKPLPKFKVGVRKIKRIINRGKWITLSGFFIYLFENIDDLVVGKLMGTHSLGLYQVAYKISSLPITEAAAVFHKVTFPVFVAIKNDNERLRKAFIRVLISVTLLIVPFGLILIIFTKPLVLLFLGTNWLPIVNLVKILTIYGIARSIFGLSTPLFLSVKKQEYITRVTGVAIIGLSLSIIPFVKQYGYLGAGYSALLGWLFAIPVIIYYLIKTFGMKNET